MRFSYNKLWKLLIDRNMSKKELAEKSNISVT
ncbi:MAG: helix-turn-helix transcriptional regulator, partial [Bacilli bacterium]|nr:helix-turn-helix transcriptional regulator [Bacilli bacterium]